MIVTATSDALPDALPIGGLVRELDTGILRRRDGELAWVELARRIQLRRQAGWRMPEGTIKVDRSGPWGNPWCVEKVGGIWTVKHRYWTSRATFPEKAHATRFAVGQFRQSLVRPGRGGLLITAEQVRAELAARWLGCWCGLGDDCHGDVLLEVANT